MFDTSQWQFFQRFFIGLLCCLGFISIAYAQHRDSEKVISVRSPVWTEELGEVPLEKYTEKELAKMVRDFWTPERMRKVIPLLHSQSLFFKQYNQSIQQRKFC